MLENLERRRLLSAGLTVTTLADSGPGSLRDAIVAANAAPGADTINFAARLRGTIHLASQLTVSDDLTINGPGANKVTVSGDNAVRVLDVTGSSTDLTIQDLTIANGLASVPAGIAYGGGILSEGADVTLGHVALSGNHAAGNNAAGGAVASLGGSLAIDHSDVTDNGTHSDDGQITWGGAIFTDKSAVASIDHATFTANKAIGGNANGGSIGSVGGSQATIDHCSFDANQAVGDADDGSFGGAIEAQSTGFTTNAVVNVSIAHCTFTGNTSSVRTAAAGADVAGVGNGGAIDLEDRAVMSIDHSTFDGNHARGGDGGDGAAGNSGGFGGSSFGGAISTGSGNLAASHCTFSNNETRGGNGGAGGAGADGGGGSFGIGGAVATTALVSGPFVPPTTSFDHCSFTGNRAIGGDGGAGGAGGNGGDASRGDGGGVITLLGSATMSDCAIVNNQAHGGNGGAPGSGAGTVGGAGGLARGGGYANERGNSATLTRTSISGNTATGGAGAAGAAGGDALGGGIFNGRLAGIGPDPALSAVLTLDASSVSDNLATGGTGGVGGDGGNAFGGGIANANPAPVSDSPILTLLGTSVLFNQANGGAPGILGILGIGQGGGLYNQPGAVASADVFSKIKFNTASTSNDDIFGVVTAI
jgi:hypothetical protein